MSDMTSTTEPAAASPLGAASAEAASPGRIRFAIVGCGRIAQRHAGHIAVSGELAACCDVVFERAEALAAAHGGRAYPTVEAMLAAEPDLDVVSVCSPNGLHARHAIAALDAGHHVLCEKPMAISVHDCGEMIQAAERANRRLFAIKQNRFNPPVQAVKRALDAGQLGRIFSVQLNCFWNRDADYYADSWRGTLDLDGGTLYTQFSHFVDLLYWMVGDVKHAQCLTANYAHEGVIRFEDTGVAVLEFYNGVIGTLHYTVNSFAKNMEGSLTIFAERGTVKIGGQYLNVLEYASLDGFEIGYEPSTATANDYGTYQGSMSNHDQVYANLVDVLQRGAAISTSAFDGLKTVEIVDKIYRAARHVGGPPVR